jgi:GH24 family phage-related lysozyme (muramidase)
MTGNPSMSAEEAATQAARLFSDNYQVEDTYYLSRRLGEKFLNQRQLDAHVEILDTIKENYLGPFKPKFFKSANPNIPDKELTAKMLFNLKAHGEFRTTANGEETVYGIVLDGGSFATIKNDEGQELSVGIGDNSKILPGGSGIVINTDLPTAQQKAQYRGYYGYGDKVKEGSMTLDREGNPTASPRFNPINELIDNLDSKNPKSAANQARYLKDIKGVTASADIFAIDGTYVDTQELIDTDITNIDFEYIAKKEGGNLLDGYTLGDKFLESGVTVGIGVDLGSKDSKYFENFGTTQEDEDLIKKLEPYFGLKGKNAIAKLNAIPLKISSKEAAKLNKFVQKQMFKTLKTKWNKESKIKFNTLSTEQATTLASVSFQYGDLKTKTPEFYKMALAGNWKGVYEELLDFKDKEKSVNDRHIELAALLKKYLDRQ